MYPSDKDKLIDLVGDALLTRDQVGTLLGKTGNAVSVDICRNKFPIPSVKVGARRLFRMSDVRAYLAGLGS